MKKYFFPMLLLALFGIGFTASDDDDDILVDGTDVPAPVEGGIVKITEGIGDADEAYVTPAGFFTYTEEADENPTVGEESVFSTISYLSVDGQDIATLLFRKSDQLPSQLVIKDEGIIYFSYPSATIVELVFDDNENVNFIGSYEFDPATLPGNEFAAEGDIFKAALANCAAILKLTKGAAARATTRSSFISIIDEYINLFETIVNQDYDEDSDVADDLPKDSDGNYQFAETLDEWVEEEISNTVYYTLSLWTGKATFKVGGSSCTLSATIWCPSNVFNDYGTYGIICDADESKLFVGEAEYEGTGIQSDEDNSYDVDFRGFKPNTTYYYRAYYKFNSSDHGPIILKYGNQTDDVMYDTTIKSFTTGDNILTVDVVMCIDVTGSMGGTINSVQNNAIAFYDLFKAECENEGINLSGLNAQVIGFGDKNVDGANWLDVSPTYWLPEQKSEFDGFVRHLYAHGGGDTPESGLEALNAAFNKTDWSADDGYSRQVIILWTDAPYLATSPYTDLTVAELEAKWNTMSSGRRMLLYAPYGTYDYNGGDWGAMDSWKNVIHSTDLYSGFGTHLKQIIGELTSKSRAYAPGSKKNISEDLFFRPNE